MRRVALVTGCARGIGRATALRLAEQGHDIVINDLPEQYDLCQTLLDDVRLLGRRSLIGIGDVACPTQMSKLFESIDSTFGRLDVLVANAYTSKRAALLEQRIEDVKRTIDVCQIGSYQVAQAAAKRMVARVNDGRMSKTGVKNGGSNGSIVFVSSVMGHGVLFSGAIPYAMSKAAISHMGKSMARELAPHHINVNIVLPGYTDTPGERQYTTDEHIAKCAAAMPWGRLGKPQDIANLIGFLCSEHAEYITGAAIPVDGGYTVSMSLPLPPP